MIGTNSGEEELPRSRENERTGCKGFFWYLKKRRFPILRRFRELAGLTLVLPTSPGEYCENVTSTLVRALPLIVTLEPRTSFFKGLHKDERRDQFQQAR
jgi:hypothetical protein